MNICPMDRPACGPYTTSMMLGGIRIPRVPEATIVPEAKDLSYPRFTIGARAIRLRIVTEAAITPRQVAKMVPKITVTIANPPRMLPSASYRLSYSSFVTP